jgi:hypothetical protein
MIKLVTCADDISAPAQLTFLVEAFFRRAMAPITNGMEEALKSR